ncbi:4228_t:CDS:10 [Diversispora eburnea]|uniref:4228_t:CDS:1 n=4 Tax=Diversisporales TaxID=214509 RepID=A0A9N9F5H2_9GLOM|nr:4228_t:CDS:10 [Diversispora eburnea]
MNVKWLFQSNRHASEQPQQNTKLSTPDQFIFTWTVRDYHEVADLYPTGRWFYSDSFVEPSHPQPTSKISNDNSDYLWRMCMYPNGVSQNDKNYLGLFLKAIPTDHERDGNSSGRERTYAFEVYRLESSLSTSLIVIFGRRQFLKLSEVYPDPTSKFDLIVRVRITNEENAAMMAAIADGTHGEFPLSTQIPKYFDDDRFCDVEFTFQDGTRIKAHRIILASQSKYFESLLSGQWVEGRSKIVPIKEIDYEIFRCVLFYLYTGKLEENLELDILKTAYMKADMLGLETFGKLLANRIAEDVNNDNWDEILLLGWQMNDSCLKNAAMQFIVSRWDELKNTENMQRVVACGNVDWIEELIASKIFGVHDSSDISNNLHGAVTKAITQKVLTNLVDKEEVSCKTYGKQSDQFETPSPNDLNEMDTKIQELKKEVNDYKDRNKQLQSVLNGLNNSLTNEQIETKINGLEKENKGYEERLTILRSGAKQLTEEEKKQIDELYEKNRKLWRQRKRMFEEIFNQIAEATERKTKDLVINLTFIELGIETDPIDINEDPLKNFNYLFSTLYPKLSPAATSRGAGTRNSIISVDSYYSSSSSNNTLYDEEEEIKEIIPMTTICVEQEIHRVAFKTLQQSIDLLKSLPNDEGFVYESKHVPSSTIGKHVRHVCDHFKSLFESKPLSLQRLGYTTDKFDLMDKPPNWNLDYDNRNRKSSIETSRMLAIKQIEQLQSTITNDCTTVPLSTPINISVTVDSDPLIDNSVPLQSTYGRELWFCCLHAIHHYALIRVICIEQDLSYPENFDSIESFSSSPFGIKYLSSDTTTNTTSNSTSSCDVNYFQCGAGCCKNGWECSKSLIDFCIVHCSSSPDIPSCGDGCCQEEGYICNTTDFKCYAPTYLFIKTSDGWSITFKSSKFTIFLIVFMTLSYVMIS